MKTLHRVLDEAPKRRAVTAQGFVTVHGWLTAFGHTPLTTRVLSVSWGGGLLCLRHYYPPPQRSPWCPSYSSGLVVCGV